MKYLVLGDLHCRSVWKDIVVKEGDSCDKIIFLGDYTCPREIELEDPTDTCGFLYDILDYKDKNSDKVVLLRGNHDVCSLGYYWAECCPKDHPNVQRYWQTKDVSNWFLKNTQWIYQIPDTNIICSHAGVSEQFLENAERYLANNMMLYNPFEETDNRWNWIICNINNIEPCELFGFTPCKLSDYYGDSATQPCTWIRPYTLIYYGIKDFIQVVGHTRMENICNLRDEVVSAAKDNDVDPSIYNEYKNVWCCDNLENGEYLIIEDGEFKPCKLC